MKKLPIGIQDYKEIIEGNYIYVDKTKYIFDLIDNGKYYFLSRPRRFGKSLTISTLYYIFKGEKELFKDTYIYDKWNFKEYPIIRLNILLAATDNEERFKKSLTNLIKQEGQRNNVEILEEDYKFAFDELILKLSRKGKVVILVDEYEKPILDNINNKEKAEKYREILRDFYVTIKSRDEYIKFVFITGITKFTKTGVFSALNNLNDISLDNDYSQMLGYTQEELEYYFDEYIIETAEKLEITKNELLQEMKKYYNGFSFDGEHFVYNPFSILKFFQKKEFENYWFESGYTSFIYEYIKGKKVTYEDLTKYPVSAMDFSSREIEDAKANIFFAQAGYLTFKGIKRYGLRKKYILDYPNIEVKNSFSELILEANYGLEEIENIIYELVDENNIEGLIEEIKRIISAIPYNLHQNRESYYHSLIYTILASAGLNVTAEELTNLGRIDLVLEHNDKIYLFEIKLDKSAKEAIEQIKEKKYYEKYKNNEVYIIGINIDSEKRNIDEYIIEKVKYSM
ncbi:ATP-binding protein [Marinitoga litoralis]|uniref:ATP-binding protein n=1 Tax=Marinitoga litoralis TaxID=570855 RepID=UPI00195F6268|nr:ATP-binding protein [Marinitoga litoralis]MBM7558709.1 Holliday junction resolvase-like predicted endonuclease [Marinitoga litoralis]